MECLFAVSYTVRGGMVKKLTFSRSDVSAYIHDCESRLQRNQPRTDENQVT